MPNINEQLDQLSMASFLFNPGVSSLSLLIFNNSSERISTSFKFLGATVTWDLQIGNTYINHQQESTCISCGRWQCSIYRRLYWMVHYHYRTHRYICHHYPIWCSLLQRKEEMGLMRKSSATVCHHFVLHLQDKEGSMKNSSVTPSTLLIT